jgi:single-strand DNA-binding protein
MAYLNKVLLIGNLTRDPEVRQVPGGQSVCKFGLATNRRFKTPNGEMREDTTFVDITVWGVRGETLSKYLKKGDPVFIEGRLNFEEWQDKTSGQKRSKLTVTAEDWQFVSSRGDGSRGSQGNSAGAPRAGESGGGMSGGGGSFDDEGSLDAGGGVPF